ncbi:MAG TPA: hypothetical protein VJ454_11890, partial [Steroidobacteraceae bacterium]|nr:hypothetical protein [Steroidobacteraceae bacterium]
SSALLSRHDARQATLGVEVRERVPAEVAVGDSAVRVRGPPGIDGRAESFRLTERSPWMLESMCSK